jgi:exonuclease III
MASLNINSLLAHIDEFRVFMNESDIDIISINETKLDSSIKDNEVYIYLVTK